jgi:hypothetical protein
MPVACTSSRSSVSISTPFSKNMRNQGVSFPSSRSRIGTLELTGRSACCWLVLTVEMSSPELSVVRR